jgi:hypothetical protein
MIKGLSKVKKVELRPSVKIDLKDYAEDECFLELSEPTAAALFPDTSTLQRLKIKYPTYPEAMIYQIALLGKCYVHQPDEPESVNPMQDFGDLAKNNKECFYHILTEFLNAFPTSNFDERVTEAKNG